MEQGVEFTFVVVLLDLLPVFEEEERWVAFHLQTKQQSKSDHQLATTKRLRTYLTFNLKILFYLLLRAEIPVALQSAVHFANTDIAVSQELLGQVVPGWS